MARANTKQQTDRKKVGVMASSTVASPAKELIEIVPDEDWMELTGTTSHGLRQWYGGAKPWVIAELWLRGPVENKSGQATKVLFERIQKHFPEAELPTKPTGFTGIFRDPLNSPAFSRAINGKRTFSIGLVAMPNAWHAKLLQMLPKQKEPTGGPIKPTLTVEPDPIEAVIDKEPIDQDEGQSISDEELEALFHETALDAPTTYEIAPPLELSIASQVAMSLLTTVVEIISAGSSEAIDDRVKKLHTDLEDIQHKLGMRLQENDQLRRQLRQAGDEIIALRSERDGLRSRLRATEANLTAALKGDAATAINGEIQRRLDSIMRVAPKAKGD